MSLKTPPTRDQRFVRSTWYVPDAVQRHWASGPYGLDLAWRGAPMAPDVFFTLWARATEPLARRMLSARLLDDTSRTQVVIHPEKNSFTTQLFVLANPDLERHHVAVLIDAPLTDDAARVLLKRYASDPDISRFLRRCLRPFPDPAMVTGQPLYVPGVLNIHWREPLLFLEANSPITIQEVVGSASMDLGRISTEVLGDDPAAWDTLLALLRDAPDDATYVEVLDTARRLARLKH